MKYFVKTIPLILTIVVVLSATLLSTSAAKPGKSGIVDIQLKGEKNIEGDTSPIEAGWAGAAIKIGSKDITVTGVGRMFFSTANISHAFLITDSEGALMLSGVTVQGYEDSVDGNFEYAYLEKSEYITLKAGNTYYLCSDFYGSMDKFYEASVATTTGDFEFIGKVNLKTDGSWAYTEAKGIDYLPVDILYMVDGETEITTSTAIPENKETDEAELSSTNKTNTSENAGSQFPVVPIAVGAAAVIVAVVVVVVILVSKKKKKTE